MNIADKLTKRLAAATFVSRTALWMSCIGFSIAGCSHDGVEKDRSGSTGSRSLRELEADRLDRVAAEEDALTPVRRLFVNGDVIEIEDILRPIRGELTTIVQNLPAAGYQQVLHDRIIPEFRSQVRALLLYQDAAKRLSERENEFFAGFVDDAVRKRVNTEYGGRQSRYEKALIEQGLTVAEDRERLRREMVIARHLHQTVTTRVLDPTRVELARFFEERKDDLSKPERRRMSLIEIPRAAGVGSRGDADAREAIARAKAELDAGTDFAEVVRKYSKGIHAEEGGVWDWLSRASVREHWEPAVEKLFELSVGRTGAVIETDEAFFIVRCDAIDAGAAPDFEAMQPELNQVYRDVQFNRMVEERVRELQQEAVFVPENVGRFLQAVADAAPKPKEP